MKQLFYISLIIIALMSFSFAQNKGKNKSISQNSSDSKLISKLVVTTKNIYPFKDVANKFGEMFVEKLEIILADGIEDLAENLKKNSKVSASTRETTLQLIAERKNEVKKEATRFFLEWFVTDFFPVEKTITTNIAEIYRENFTQSELKRLDTYFSSLEGKKLIRQMRESILAKLQNAPSDELKMALAENIFLQSSLGQKFKTVGIESVGQKFISKFQQKVQSTQTDEIALSAINEAYYDSILNAVIYLRRKN